MEPIINLLRELCLYIVSRIISLFRSLLVIFLVAVILIGCLLYRMAIWAAEHPAVLILPPAALLLLWLFKRYVLGREIMVSKDSAVIVRRAGGTLEPLYRGWHRLKLADTVCGVLSLRPESTQTNLEEVFTFDEERVRLSAVYQYHISDPVPFYRRGRKNTIDFVELNQWALLTVIQDFSSDDLYNAPHEINARIEQSINDQLHGSGLRVSNYRLDELVWPETNEQWRRNRSQLPFQAGHYWNEARGLRQRIC